MCWPAVGVSRVSHGYRELGDGSEGPNTKLSMCSVNTVSVRSSCVTVYLEFPVGSDTKCCVCSGVLREGVFRKK